ncbi:hypothetical protein CHKEEEPN_4992 [Methylorubrum podarium]|nr:hypothetical protein CHKEEEPN_4992 [Methylorubrum podarium]
MLKQLLQRRIREALLVVEIYILKDAAQPMIRILNRVKGSVQVFTDVGGVSANVLPESALWDVKAMFIWVRGKFSAAITL